MNTRYAKTPAGHAEIQSKTFQLPRAVRNLLLVINESQPDDYWLQQIRGVSEADLEMLRSAQLITPLDGPVAASSGSTLAAPAAADPQAEAAMAIEALRQADRERQMAGADSALGADDSAATLWGKVNRLVRETSYSTLYDVLTAQGKSTLGLMRGYRFALEVERCEGLPELQGMAQQFLEQLRDDHGMSAVRRFYDALRRN
jgi:hypothetical protein